MDNIKQDLLYKILINDLKLTSKVLAIYGYKQEDIVCLIEEGIIEEKTKKEYKLVTVDKFRQYGIKLLKAGNTDAANRCFEKCYEMDSSSKNICMQYFLSLLKRKKYEEIFKVLDSLYNIEPEKNKENNNLYLYLLSFFTECPQEYIDRIRNLEYDDLMQPMVKGNKLENEIRGAIIKGKFKFAYQQVNTLLAKLNDYSPKYELLKELLNQVIREEKEFKTNLLNLANEEKYSEIVLVLKNIRYLNNLETYILLIAENIVKIIETKAVPIATIGVTDSMYQALIGNNFKLALEINNNFKESVRENTTNDILNILLVKLNNLVLEIKSDYQVIDMNNSLSKERIIKREIVPLQYSRNNSELDKDILAAEEFAYYIANENIKVEDAIKKFGLRIETVLLIKLVYVRDYYIEKKFFEGDLLLKEIEVITNKSSKVLYFLDKVNEYRNAYFEEIDREKGYQKKLQP